MESYNSNNDKPKISLNRKKRMWNRYRNYIRQQRCIKSQRSFNKRNSKNISVQSLKGGKMKKAVREKSGKQG